MNLWRSTLAIASFSVCPAFVTAPFLLRFCCFERVSPHRPRINTTDDFLVANPVVADSTGSQTLNSWPVLSHTLGAREGSWESGARPKRGSGLGSGVEPHQTFSRMSPYSPHINQGLGQKEHSPSVRRKREESRTSCHDHDHHVQEIMRAALAGQRQLRIVRAFFAHVDIVDVG
jgi:hypothetical protein